MYTSNQSETEKTLFLYIVVARLTSVSLVVIVKYTACIINTLTPVLTILYTVIIQVFLQCFLESVSLTRTREIYFARRNK